MSEISQELAQRMAAVIPELASLIEAATCQHENTHRGGFLWTICDDCDQRWADDQGGFVPYVEPAALTEARAIVAELPAPVDPDLIEAQKLYLEAVNGTDGCSTWELAMARAIKRGRELERSSK